MQVGTCKFQAKSFCARSSGNMKHACAYAKAGGGICGGSHTKQDHDITKHGN